MLQSLYQTEKLGTAVTLAQLPGGGGGGGGNKKANLRVGGVQAERISYVLVSTPGTTKPSSEYPQFPMHGTIPCNSLNTTHTRPFVPVMVSILCGEILDGVDR